MTHRRDDDPDSDFRPQRNGRRGGLDTLTKWVVSVVLLAITGGLGYLLAADRNRVEKRADDHATAIGAQERVNAQQTTDIEVLKTSVIGLQETLKDIKSTQGEILKEMRDGRRENH